MRSASALAEAQAPSLNHDELARAALGRRPSESPEDHGRNGLVETPGMNGALEGAAAGFGFGSVSGAGAGMEGSNGNHPESSTPVRKDTSSSVSTAATSIATLASIATNESGATVYSVDSSPTNYAAQAAQAQAAQAQAMLSAKDESHADSQARRPSRRRTGPLSAVQRERAALIRKMGACNDCRRRRVACHPNHHNMTWEEAAAKFRAQSPTAMADFSPVNGGRTLSPAPVGSKLSFTQDPQEMEIDSTPTHQPSRPSINLGDGRIRTPLPSGPRPDKFTPALPQPSIDTAKNEMIQNTISRMLSSPVRSPYVAVETLLLHWSEDEDPGVRPAMEELAQVLSDYYHYTLDIKSITPSADDCKNSWRWLSRVINDFVDRRDQRDVLKIVYYNGHTYLDANREMVLASSKHADATSSIRWSGIQQILESAISDTLILMDAAYYPSSKLVRQQGVLEMIAVSASEDHAEFLDRGTFTRALTSELRTRASQKFMSPMSAAELHAKLLTLYPKMVQDRNPEQEVITRFPSPLHLQLSGTSRLPSILLSPVHRGPPLGLESPPSASGSSNQLTITFRLSEESINTDSWIEWLRLMPDGVKDARVDGPYRASNTFR